MQRLFLLGLAACLVGCTGRKLADCQPAPDPVPLGSSVTEALSSLDGLEFDAFIDRSFDELVLRSPKWITDLDLSEALGVGNDELDDVSLAFLEDTDRLYRGLLDRLEQTSWGELSSEQEVTRDVYAWWLDDRLRFAEVRDYDYLVAPTLSSIQTNVPLLLTEIDPLDTLEDAEDYAARLHAFGRKVDQTIERLDRVADLGLAPPRDLLEWSLPAIDDTAETSNPKSHALYTHLSERLSTHPTLSNGEAKDVLRDAEEALQCQVIPSFQRLGEAVRAAMSGAPSGAGVGSYEGGEAFYEWALRHHTSTELTADEVHELGLADVDRIHAQMREHFADLGYPQNISVSDAFARVADDGGFVGAEDVVSTYEALIEGAEARLDVAFHEGPPTDVVVIGGDSGGFYISGTPDGSRPGAFYAQVGGWEARYHMASLAYHEAIPGHHLQISLSQAVDRPQMRRSVHFTAYIEGWALYAEWLAADLGWYEGDPYGDLGRLQYEVFRAARLVVDTGLHAKGWNFGEAATYFEQATGWSRPAVNQQIGRYMSWPGQATAYKVGMEHLLELRSRSESELGDAFDVRDFHSAVLDEGAVPLEVLDGVVDDYIELAR